MRTGAAKKTKKSESSCGKAPQQNTVEMSLRTPSCSGQAHCKHGSRSHAACGALWTIAISYLFGEPPHGRSGLMLSLRPSRAVLQRQAPLPRPTDARHAQGAAAPPTLRADTTTTSHINRVWAGWQHSAEIAQDVVDIGPRAVEIAVAGRPAHEDCSEIDPGSGFYWERFGGQLFRPPSGEADREVAREGGPNAGGTRSR